MILEELKTKSIKQLNIKELNLLCQEIREKIIRVVDDNGGHLASNLGVVELTVALYYVYDFPTDKLIFDVGHQSYVHKILSGRIDDFNSIRKEDGLSGFPDSEESEFDAFSVGHAGTSISAGLGYAYSRDRLKKDYNVINVVGDASFFNGENLEAITSQEVKPKKFLVILNDNGMSINKNNNGGYKFISSITTTRSYNAFNDFLSRTVGKTFIGAFLRGIKNWLKRCFSSYTIFDTMNIKYVGMFDGHDLKHLIKLLTRIKDSENPTLLHIRTKKGKGLTVAENDSVTYHGVGKHLTVSKHDYSENVSTILEKYVQKHDNLFAITAGMIDGVGLSPLAKKYPKVVIDTGIAEGYAVTLAGGIAISGGKPIVFIYSTFLQRAYDQILHDVCIQNLPVVFCLDRAGLVGSDGKTHQGVFDLSYLSSMPNMVILSPKDVNEFDKMLDIALQMNSPVAIRYNNGTASEFESVSEIDKNLKWEELKQGSKTCIFAVGGRMLDIAYKVSKMANDGLVAVVNARSVKPLDFEMLNKYSNHKIITLEDNTLIGGFYSQCLKYYADNNIKVDIKGFGIKDEFISHASVESQLAKNGITVENIIKYI